MLDMISEPMKRIYGLWCFFLTLPGLCAQQAPAGIDTSGIGINYRIHPSTFTQSEVFIVRSPLDPEVLFSACNTISFVPFFISEGIYVSADAGTTWKGSDTCTGNPIGYHGGDPGITIDKNGTFILTRLGRSPFVGLYSHYSTDNGHTWSSQQVISTDDLERAALSSDVNPASPFSGRTYALWTKLSQPFAATASYTSDSAQTWSTPLQVNHPSTRSAGGDIAVGPGGKVYACWAGVTESSPFKEVMVGFASSPDGGDTWYVTENAFAVNGITGLLSEKHNIRVNGLPNMAVDTTGGSRQGWIYIVTGQKELAPAGNDPDIILYRSNDGGATWSAGIRVNQDPLNNGKIQYFPNIYIDQFSAVNVIFYDDRNTTSDSTGVFLARSLDGGDTWQEFELSDHHFMPEPIGGLGQGYQGDVIDLTSTGSKLWPVWMDNSSGIYQVWTTPVDFSFINAVENRSDSPGPFVLDQNYPNPFASVTRIRYQVRQAGEVSLRIFDVTGRLVAEPVQEWRHPGTYEVDIDPAGYGAIAGIYCYRLTLRDRSETRKMILVK
jgi:hypothetical protein